MTTSPDPADTVLVIQQQDGAGPGWLAEALDEAGIPYEIARPYTGQRLPDTVAWRGIVPLGGTMGAYELDEHPFLRDEMQFLQQAAAAGTPVLGICLGSQLLAEVLGGDAHPATETRSGYPEIDLTVAGRQDRVLRHAAGPRYLVWHGDTFDPPPDATLLATSEGYPYAYRIGSVVAVQFHPEASPQLVDAWLDAVDEAELQRMGIDPETLHHQVHDKADACRAASFALFRAWIDETAEGTTRRQAGGRRQR